MSIVSDNIRAMTFAETYERAKSLLPTGYVSLKFEVSRYESGREEPKFWLAWIPTNDSRVCQVVMGNSLESVIGQLEARLLQADGMDEAMATLDDAGDELATMQRPDRFEQI
jgi:hypothetical protein